MFIVNHSTFNDTATCWGGARGSGALLSVSTTREMTAQNTRLLRRPMHKNGIEKVTQHRDPAWLPFSGTSFSQTQKKSHSAHWRSLDGAKTFTIRRRRNTPFHFSAETTTTCCLSNWWAQNLTNSPLCRCLRRLTVEYWNLPTAGALLRGQG